VLEVGLWVVIAEDFWIVSYQCDCIPRCPCGGIGRWLLWYDRENSLDGKATWQGTIGTAVTITQSKGTKEFEGAKYVGFEFCQWGRSGAFWGIADFSVPVMKLEPLR
jgi:hypothetical protein